MRCALLGLALIALAPAPGRGHEPDNAIDARIRASAAGAQSYQGPLDGAWTLVSAAGQPIFAFQLVDKPGGREPLEGVWRDLRRPQTPGDIGFIDGLIRTPDGGLAITLSPRAGSPAVSISLRTGPDGAWSGQMREGGVSTQVKLRRSS